jgi:hypothetical protein
MSLDNGRFPIPRNKYYIYTAAYPTGFLDEKGIDLGGIVFYVGFSKTRGGIVQQRMQEHESYARNRYVGDRYDVIRQIWQAGKQVQWRIVFESYERSDALDMEKHCIRNVYAGPHLTNLSHNPALDSYAGKLEKALEQWEQAIDERLHR